MEKKSIVIFGASNYGKKALNILKEDYKILFFSDNDPDKWGKKIDGVEVINPLYLKELTNVEIIIASSFTEEILLQLQKLGISEVKVFKYNIEPIASWNTSKKKINVPLVNLGEFFRGLNTDISIDDVTFMTGGSSVLDYMFLKSLMIKFQFKTYLEIGTWMGESIATISDIADKCYSISLPDNDTILVDYFRDVNGKSNFSRYFSYKKNNIVHYQTDSKEFDFSIIPDKIDLVFIDGDHTYQGVKTDTENIFKIIDQEETMVVWHDFKNLRNEFLLSTVQAIYAALPERLHKNIFGVDNNMCGIYIPDKYLDIFSFENDPDVVYSYRTTITSKLNRKIDESVL